MTVEAWIHTCIRKVMFDLILLSVTQMWHRELTSVDTLHFSCFCLEFSHFHGFPCVISSTIPFPISVHASRKPPLIPQTGTQPPPPLHCCCLIGYHCSVKINHILLPMLFITYWSLISIPRWLLVGKDHALFSLLSQSASNVESFNRWFGNISSQSVVCLFIVHWILQGANF